MKLNPRARELLLVIGSGALLLSCYHWIFSAFFPTANGTAGHDYAYFLPALLDGYYWQLNNGLLAPEWFTPAFCGGLPAFFNPINLYYSLPQWLTNIVDPLQASYLTLLTFAALGFCGFYLLLRISFKTAIATALLGATLFMFNGFFSHRVVIGHLTYHAFMLTPLIAFLLLPLGNSKKYLNRTTLLQLSIASVLFAYTIYSGLIHLILPVILALVFIGTLHGILHGKTKHFWLNILFAGGASILLTLPKLAPSIMYINNFERTDYLLPGAESLWGLLTLVFETLFLQPSSTTASALVNVQWLPSRHELEYGITFIPLIIVILGLAFWIKKTPALKHAIGRSPKTNWLQLALLILVLAVPLAINIYSPDWNALLKQIPVIKNSSTLIRWFSIYIPVFILCAALLLDKTAQLRRIVPHICIASIIGVVLINFNVERSYYANQPYETSTITKVYKMASANQQAQTITKLSAFQDSRGRPAIPLHRNNALVEGASQLLCYEPLFGYRLESFPKGFMVPGMVSWVKDGYFNLKNPACYVFGDANNCKPGDHFSVTQANSAKAFVNYQPFDFSAPGWWSIANWAALCLFAAILLVWVAYPILIFLDRKTSTDS